MFKENSALQWNAHAANDQAGANVSVIGSEALEEQHFRNTLEALLDVFSDNHHSYADKMQNILHIGLNYFNMQSALVCSSMGKDLELISAAGEIASHSNPGDKIPLEGRACIEVLDTDDVVALSHISTNAPADKVTPIHGNIQSYIGTQVLTSNGPLGVLSFLSDSPRENEFNQHDKRIISLIANWIGTMIGAEEQLEFLALQNDYYQSLFSTVPAMMMLCNRDGLILSTSDLFSHRIGVNPLSVPGQNCHNYFLADNKAVITEALNAGDVSQLPLTLRYENGETLEVEFNSNIKHVGSMQGVRMIVLTDVSDRNTAMKAVEEQNKQLGMVNQSLNQFAFIASHDLQEPLRKIQQFSSFLEEDMADVMTDDGRYHLDVIVNSTKRMSTLIQDLLVFSSTAKGELELSDIDLSELMTEVCSELELRIEESNAQVKVGYLPVVQGDRTLIRQLLTNLVSNSIKYRDENREPVIDIQSQNINNEISITISDNGIGFDQKHAAKAFEPFNRLHTDKKYNGNGIGLSICTMVCEKHDWKLSAKSQPGSGSVFTIDLH